MSSQESLLLQYILSFLEDYNTNQNDTINSLKCPQQEEIGNDPHLLNVLCTQENQYFAVRLHEKSIMKNSLFQVAIKENYLPHKPILLRNFFRSGFTSDSIKSEFYSTQFQLEKTFLSPYYRTIEENIVEDLVLKIKSEFGLENRFRRILQVALNCDHVMLTMVWNRAMFRDVNNTNHEKAVDSYVSKIQNAIQENYFEGPYKNRKFLLLSQKSRIHPFTLLKNYCLYCKEFYCVMHFQKDHDHLKDGQVEPDYRDDRADKWPYLNRYYATRLREFNGLPHFPFSSENCKKYGTSRSSLDFSILQKLDLADILPESMLGIRKDHFDTLKMLIRYYVTNCCIISGLLDDSSYCSHRRELIHILYQKFNNDEHENANLITDCNCFSRYYRPNSSEKRKRGEIISDLCIPPYPCLMQCKEKYTYKSFKGCSCEKGCIETKCPCVKNKYECIPGICSCKPEYHPQLFHIARECFPQSSKSACCNNLILSNIKPRIVIGRSLVCEGIGLFTAQHIKKGQLICNYRGEFLNNNDEEEIRQFSNFLGTSYVFELANSKDEVIDSICYGDKSRYANHSQDEFINVGITNSKSGGENHIVFHAIRDITAGEELLFNYGENYQLDWTIHDKKITRLLLAIKEHKKRMDLIDDLL